MRIVVPFDAVAPKTRLGRLFDADERAALATVMLEDVLAAIDGTRHAPRVLATAPIDCGVPVDVDERPLTTAVNAILAADDGATAVVMADLPLATPASLGRLFDPEADLVIAPGRAGGTNAFVSRHPDFRVDYHGTSFLDHVAIAERLGLEVTVVDSHRLATDIDEVADLVEVLVHGVGTNTGRWLEARGVDLQLEAGRVTVTRE